MLDILGAVILQQITVNAADKAFLDPNTKLRFKLNKKKHIRDGFRIELSNEDSGFIKDLITDLDKVKTLHSSYGEIEQYCIQDFYFSLPSPFEVFAVGSNDRFCTRMDPEKTLKENKKIFARYIIQGANGFVPDLNCLGLFYMHLKEPELTKAKRISDMIGGIKLYDNTFLDIPSMEEYIALMKANELTPTGRLKKWASINSYSTD